MKPNKFTQACINGDIKTVKQLIDSVDPSAEGNEALRDAAFNGHLEVVKYLCSLPVKYGIDPSACQNAAIGGAAMMGHLHVVKYICDLLLDRE